MEVIFLIIYNFFSRYKWTFWCALIAVGVPIFFLASKVRLEEDITKVLPGSTNSPEYQQVLKQSGMMEKLVLRVSLSATTATDTTAAADPDRLVAYTNTFVEQLQSRQDLQPLIREIRHRIPDDIMRKAYALFYNNLPFFLDETDYQAFDTLTTEAAIGQSLHRNYLTLMSPMSLAVKEQIQSDPLHFTTRALAKLQALQINPQYEVYDGYIVSKDRKSLLLFLTPANPPSETKNNTRLMEGLNDIIGKLASAEFKDVHAEYFGASAVAVANARQIQKDIYLTVTLSVICICLLLWGYFRKFTLPLAMLLPIVFGGGFALAVIYLYKGTISSIAIGGGAIIIGIAVDYSLHVFTHYKHTRSLPTVIKDLSTPLLIGNISTIGAFLSLLFVKSDILFDFGLFSALSLGGAIVFTLVFLPQLLSFYSIGTHNDHAWLTRTGEKVAPFRRLFHRFSLVLILVLSGIFYFTYQNVQFENDLNAMNYMSPELKQAEQHLRTENEESERSVYLLFKGKTLNEALLRNEQALGRIDSLTSTKAVTKYYGVTSILVSDSMQQARKVRWQTYWTPQRKEQVRNSLVRLAPQHGFKAGAFEGFSQLLDKDFTPLSPAQIGEVKEYFLRDYISTSPENATILMACLKIPVSGGTAVYQALAAEKDLFILDRQYIIKKFVSILAEDFNQIVYTSSLLVFVILLLFYGRIELALIAFIPMLASWLWILGFMNLFDLHFNIVNVIISTFIFGLGDDYTIFMMDGHLGEYKDGTKNLPSYKVSILLSALTTLFGMGVLIFAQHPALKSIALISVVGIGCVLFIAYTLIPILFRGLLTNRTKRGMPPVTISSLISSLLAFVWFLLGCFILTITGGVLFRILRMKGEKAKLFYHYLITYFVRSLIYGVFIVKKRYRNPGGEKLTKPAIIVANHQSFLDILVLLAAHPKILLFTNDWVWNSPFFGPIVRMAGFFNVRDGVENSLEMVKESVRQGYSIAIFPEGFRSADRGIKRFHKGAFFLAEQLQLDIVPVAIHGTGLCMPKHDFLLQPGTMTIKVLPRIRPGEAAYGTCYQEVAKSTSVLIREEYARLRQEVETPAFFYHRLVQKYIYKGPVLEWYARIKIKLEKSYQPMHELVPTNGRVYDVGCGYGFLSYMLAYTSAGRTITGIDYDEKKIALADNCKADAPNVSFFASDALTYPYERADAFIINDVLHYMPKQSQALLVSTCVLALNPGGTLIIRDADASLQKRHRGTKISEFFSVKLLGFNKSAAKQLHFITSEEMLEILQPLGVEVRIINQTKYNSNIIYHIRKTAAVAHSPFGEAQAGNSKTLFQ